MTMTTGEHEHHHDHDHEEHEHHHDHDHEEHEHHHDHDHEEHEHHHDHDHECGCGCGHHHHDHEGHHHADDVFTSWGKETIRTYTKKRSEISSRPWRKMDLMAISFVQKVWLQVLMENGSISTWFRVSMK